MKTLTNFPYTNVLVLGLAKSGTAAAELLLDSDVHVRVNDLHAKDDDAVIRDLKQKGAEVILGGHPLSALDSRDLLVKNPGIPYDNPLVEEAIKRNIPVVTEVELASYLHEGPIIAITGSNGKTTTTTLIYEMIKASGRKVSVAGNIGNVSCQVARQTTNDEVMVVELSSFQLQGTEKFRPDISVLLNLYEAHLDYHKTLKAYHEAKARIFRHQTEEDTFVYNQDDDRIVSYLTEVTAKTVPFSLHRRHSGAWASDEAVFYEEEEIMPLEEIVLVGAQNLQNILAAVAVVKTLGVSNEAISQVLRTFKGVEHRLQFVTEINGRSFYNDSKATNILATSYALRSFKQDVILLAGGLDRGNDFDGLVPYLDGVKAMILFGETAEKLQMAAEEAGVAYTARAETMEEAVHLAYSASSEQDVILLSPACASWDQYKTFEERGNMFTQSVHKLK